MHATANEYNESLKNVALHCLPNDIDAVGAAEVTQEAWTFPTAHPPTGVDTLYSPSKKVPGNHVLLVKIEGPVT